MAKLYQIRDWDENFEVAQTRKVAKLQWVAMPVKHDGLSFRRLMAHPDGLECFGVWNLLVQVAGKCSSRGVLATSDGRPLTAKDISVITGGEESGIETAMQVLSSPDIAWLIETDTTPLPDGYHSATRTLPLQDKQNTTEQNTTRQNSSSSVVVDSGDAEEEPFVGEWLEVVNALQLDGMGLAMDACRTARSRGCMASEVRRLHEHWKAHPAAWSLGVLCNKIRGLVAGGKTVWPEKSAEWHKRQREIEKDDAAAKQIEQRKNGQKKVDSQKSRAAELEKQFGAELDAMSKEELREFVQLRLPTLLPFLVFPVTGMTREHCLAELSVAKRRDFVSEVPSC